MPQLRQASRERQKGSPIFLNSSHAEILLEQFIETTNYRNWTLIGVAIMPNHVHWLVEVEKAANPDDVLGDFKSYGSRVLNKKFGKPKSGTWWTVSGSKRHKDPASIPHLIEYLKKQHNQLLIWINPDYE